MDDTARPDSPAQNEQDPERPVAANPAADADGGLDAVTGLPDAATLRARFAAAAQARGLAGSALAVLEFDGFAAGDAVLRRALELASEGLRQEDLVARWDEDEFVVLRPGGSAAALADDLRRGAERLRGESFLDCAPEGLALSFSAGVTGIHHGAALDEGLTAARHLLRLARSSGRAQVVARADAGDSSAARVLLVEDDNIVAAIVARLLGAEGLRVTRFPTAEETLAAAEPGFDLALLDVNLPGMSGFDLLERLRASAPFENVPVLMLTATRRGEDVARGRELGAAGYVAKPFSPVELVTRVRRLLPRA